MTQVEEHIAYLLGDWKYSERLRSFMWNNFRIQHHDGELELRLASDFIYALPLHATASLRDVHHALRDLFDSVPQYNVVHLQVSL